MIVTMKSVFCLEWRTTDKVLIWVVEQGCGVKGGMRCTEPRDI